MVRAEREVTVEVVYALPDRQTLLTLTVPAGATVREALVLSGLPAIYPEIDSARNRIGIFGKRVPPDTRLNNGDRVEIYRPLTVDPKEARRRRARTSK